MKKRLFFLIFLLAIDLANAGYYDYNDVLLVSNNQSAISMNISNYFFTQRGMTYKTNISVTEQETINFTTFNISIKIPIENYLTQNNLVNNISYIVLTKGIPLRIENPIGSNCFASNHQCASVDSELTLILGKYNNSIGGTNSIGNPYSGQEQRFSKQKYDIYLVTRLDSYQNDTDNDGIPDDVKNLIDHAGKTVNNGTFVLDQDPNWGSTGNINNYLSSANSSLKGKGYNTSTNADNIFIVNQSNVIGYFSWGSNDYNDHSYTINSIPGNMYVNGSIGETAVSTSARTFNSTNRNYGQSLAADLIHEGITGVKGYAYEPYASAIANSNILFNRYADGFNLAESFYMASSYLSWTDVIIGDPKTFITNDSANPVIILDAPINNSLMLNGTYLNFTITDNVQLSTAWYNFNNTNTTFAANNYYINTQNWSSGTNNITIYANDTVGNSKTKYFVFDINLNAVGSLPIYSNFNGNTTEFTRVLDKTNITNLTLEKINLGRIDFLQSVNVSGSNLNTYVIISDNFISIDSNNLQGLNKSANLSLYNLNFNYTPVIMKDGIKCGNLCSTISYGNGTLKFNVTSFSNYFATSNSNLTIWDEADTGMPYAGFAKYINNQTFFFANYSNLTSGALITTANCTITFSDLNDNMTLNTTKNLFQFNRSFFSGGSYSYTTACTNSGFENITLSDSINILSNIVYLQPSNNTILKYTSDINLNWTNFTVNTQGKNLTYILDVSNTSDFSNIVYNGRDTFVNYTGSPGLVGGFSLLTANPIDGGTGGFTTNGSDFWISDIAGVSAYTYHFNAFGTNMTGTPGIVGGFDRWKSGVISTLNRGITTNGSDFWIADVTNAGVGYVYHFDAFGTNITGSSGLTGGFSGRKGSSNIAIRGITTNGSDFWISDQTSGHIYHFDAFGNNITGNPGLEGGFNRNVAASFSPSSITSNGSDFWIVGNNDFVYHINYFGNNITDGFDLFNAYGSSAFSGAGIENNFRLNTIGLKSPNDFWISDTVSNYVYHFKGAVQEQGINGNTTAHTISIQLNDNTNYYWRVKAFDGDTESNYVYGTFTVNTASTSSSSSTGSGGGGSLSSGNGDGSCKTINVNKDLGNVLKNEYRDIKFLENNAIVAIRLNILEDKENVNIEIKNCDYLSNIPLLVNAYTYLKIDLENLNSINAKIDFKVQKEWITNNNYDASTVILQRFDNGWNRIITKKTGEDSNYIYYSAKTDRFSYFAITAEKIKLEEKTEEITDKTKEKNISKETILKNKENKIVNYLIVLIIISLLILLFIYYRLRKSNKVDKTEVLKDYIKIYRLKGYSKEDIKEIALKKGWDKKTIERIFENIR